MMYIGLGHDPEPPVQAEQVAGLEHQRPDLKIAARGEMELIIERLCGRAARASPRPADALSPRSAAAARRSPRAAACPRPKPRRPAAAPVAHRDHEGDRLADFRFESGCTPVSHRDW